MHGARDFRNEPAQAGVPAVRANSRQSDDRRLFLVQGLSLYGTCWSRSKNWRGLVVSIALVTLNDPSAPNVLVETMLQFVSGNAMFVEVIT
jgi:hypothetical protein